MNDVEGISLCLFKTTKEELYKDFLFDGFSYAGETKEEKVEN